MKKVLKSILAVVLTFVIFSATITASAASNSIPELVINEQGVKSFTFKPTPYFLNGNETCLIQDATVSSGFWHVPAGNRILWNIHFVDTCYYKLYILKEGEGAILITDVQNEKYPAIELQAIDTDANYMLVVLAASEAEVMSYFGYVRP